MKLPSTDHTRLAIGCVRMARHEIRWWFERFSEHELAGRFAKILDELDALERQCRTSTTAHAAGANAAPEATNARLLSVPCSEIEESADDSE
jgi:hypothetical protein